MQLYMYSMQDSSAVAKCMASIHPIRRQLLRLLMGHLKIQKLTLRLVLLETQDVIQMPQLSPLWKMRKLEISMTMHHQKMKMSALHVLKVTIFWI